MIIELLIKGFIIGLSVAAPVGPIGILTIKRTLNEGRKSGFATGLGAAVADTCYGLIAGFGMSAVWSFLNDNSNILKLVGACFLLYLGFNNFFSKPAEKEANLESKGLFNNFFTTFLLTISNPATIFSFIAIMASVGVGESKNNLTGAATIVIGVFLGSAAWWYFLSFLVSSLKHKFTKEKMLWVNRISGILIILFALWALASGLRII